MSLPSSWKTVRVFGKYLNTDGSPVRGAVQFDSNIILARPDAVVIPKTVVAKLDSQGAFSVDLPATDDPTLLKQGSAYTVTERFAGGRAPFYIAASYTETEINLTTAAPLVAAPALESTKGPKGDPGVPGATDYNLLANKPVFGTAATMDASAFATAAQGATADAAIPASQLGIAFGVAELGSDGKLVDSMVPASMLGQVTYKGLWDATSGTAPIAEPQNGWYYIVSVQGSTNLDGIADWNIGDWAIFTDTTWRKVDNTDAVVSVAGLTGAVSVESLRAALGPSQDSRIVENLGTTTESLAIGSGATINAAYSSNATVVGQNASSGDYNTVSLGAEANSYGNAGISVGYQATAGIASVAIGKNAAASPDTSSNSSIAIGFHASVSASEGVAIGDGASIMANGAAGIAIGQGSSVNGTLGIAIGAGTHSNDTNAITVGAQATSGAGSTVIGTQAVSLPYCVNVGAFSNTGGNYSVAIGYASRAGGIASIALGYSAQAQQDNTVSVGVSANASAQKGTAIGSSAASGFMGASLGYSANAQGTSSVAIGSQAVASHARAIALGSGYGSNHTTADDRATIACFELEVGEPALTAQTALILRDATGIKWRITVGTDGSLSAALL